MIRVMATDVVNAYKATGLIPIRQAWQTTDRRGACAIDALARSLGEDYGQEWATRLNPQYLQGFLEAWDADEPVKDPQHDPAARQGFWDAILCRDAVTNEFSSITPVEENETQQKP